MLLLYALAARQGSHFPPKLPYNLEYWKLTRYE